MSGDVVDERVRAQKTDSADENEHDEGTLSEKFLAEQRPSSVQDPPKHEPILERNRSAKEILPALHVSDAKDIEGGAAASLPEVSRIDATRKVIDGLKQGRAAKTAGEAAMVIANELADNPKVLDVLKEFKGPVTPRQIDQIQAVAAGIGHAVLEAKPFALPPKLLDARDAKTLETVRTEMESLASMMGDKIAINPEGMSEYSTEKIAERLKKEDAEKWQVDKIRRIMHEETRDSEFVEKFVTPMEPAAQHAGPRGLEAQGVRKSGETPDASGSGDAGAPRATFLAIRNDQFFDVAKQVFDKIDKDRSGKISRDEINKAMEDPSIRGEEAQALAAMYTNFSKLANLANQQGLLERSGITKEDLEKAHTMFAEHQKQRDDAYLLNEWAKQELAKFDLVKNGKLNYREIDAALNNKETGDFDRRMLTFLRENYSKIGPDGQTGISLKSIETYPAKLFNTAEGKLSASISASTWQVSRSQRTEISRELFSDSKNPVTSIVPDAVRQGTIGNCYFHASLAAVAQSNPALIKEAIKDNGDGTYTVRFPGAKDEPITVKAPTEAEQGLYNRGSEHGIWANVLEKAYGQYSQKIYRRSPFNPTGGNTPAEGGDGGGRPESVMKLLTGNSTDTDVLLVNSQSSVLKKLEDAFSAVPPKAVAAGINNTFFWDKTADNFYVAHAYSITGFVPDGKGGGSVTIRNPWAGENGTTHGTITVPLETFMKNFSQIIFEDR